MEKPGWVYIVASRRNGTIYVGSTSNLPQRVWQHRDAAADGFTKEHECKLLVWFEDCGSIDGARIREAQMKKWKRGWKLREIEGPNPEWHDLYDTIVHG